MTNQSAPAPGTPGHPLRVAVIGSGPAAFYAVQHLFRRKELTVEVDMYDRLPTPFGLVRHGVAPDHPKIKSVTRAYDRTASDPRFRFYGYVELGKDITVADLREHYHQIIYATGAQTDKPLNIPGIDLAGSHAATEFVAWYNGHPDYRDCDFDLSQETAAVVGVGNVAIDVARILCRTEAELRATDVADYALEALIKSRIKTVYLLGRRGPVQAAFTNPEIKEIGEMAGANAVTLPEEVALDPLSQADLDASDDRAMKNKVAILRRYAEQPVADKPHRLVVRFLVSPTELIGDADGRVMKMKLVRNELYRTEVGTLRPRATDQSEELQVGLVFRSIGYRGVPLDGVPFRDDWGVILNKQGRVLDPDSNEPVTGEYAAGWIKRGPSGIIGTNKPDAAETVGLMLEDLAQGCHLHPAHPEAASAEALVRQRRPDYFSYADWKRLDEIEQARGAEQNRPRVKFTSIAEMHAALGR
ncbi:MAG: FAD-dependent oxidoreductase [Anaerolineales bacterium]